METTPRKEFYVWEPDIDGENYLKVIYEKDRFFLETSSQSIMLDDKDMKDLEKAINFMRLSKNNFKLENNSNKKHEE